MWVSNEFEESTNIDMYMNMNTNINVYIEFAYTFQNFNTIYTYYLLKRGETCDTIFSAMLILFFKEKTGVYIKKSATPK